MKLEPIDTFIDMQAGFGETAGEVAAMKTPERRPETLGLWPGAWVAIILFVPLVVSTLKFGRVFTVQLMAVSFSGHEHASFACEVSAASAS